MIFTKKGARLHPFGTIKRHLGYTYFLTRGLDSVNTEGGFICLAYNLKRLINIMGVKELVRRFRESIASRLCIFFTFHKKFQKNFLFMELSDNTN
ncbi:transposase [Tepidibacillus decaturensis]|uniref:Transposase DDE domain-containing protein n=1 Tax=Tepidibacillus decaturensis TaxID=1413211 RepID=A0A135L4X1_9BACI|nr:hypothetical protein U473_08570 [Tepidibacillus decaturensis]